MIDRRALLAAGLSVPLATTANAAQARQPEPPTDFVELWPQGVPDTNPRQLAELIADDSRGTGNPNRAISGISKPRMAVFRARLPSGAAILIMPGGGYGRVMMDHEGYDLARWLAGRGVTAFVLFYRLPAEGWASGPDSPLADAQRAMRLIRHRAHHYRIDPTRVAAIGYSAGGHLCASLTVHSERPIYTGVDDVDFLPARPDLTGLIYPVISLIAPLAHIGSRERLIGSQPLPDLERAYSPHLHLTENAPACFLLHAEDDALVSPENTLLMRAALLARNVAVETHLLAKGGHGFGLRKVDGHIVGNWPELFWSFAKAQRVI